MNCYDITPIRSRKQDNRPKPKPLTKEERKQRDRKNRGRSLAEIEQIIKEMRKNKTA